jgi:hypothetical protein
MGRVREKKRRRKKIKKENIPEERRSRCVKREENREILMFPMIYGSGGSKKWPR